MSGSVNNEAECTLPQLKTQFFHIVAVESASSLDMPRHFGDLYRYANWEALCVPRNTPHFILMVLFALSHTTF